jgi:hypothetical protein
MHERIMAMHHAWGHPSNRMLAKMMKCVDGHGLSDEEMRAVHDMPRCPDCDKAQLPKHQGAKSIDHKRMCIPNKLIMHSDLSGKKAKSTHVTLMRHLHE